MAETKQKIDVKEMIKAGVHLGHRTSKLHPHMQEFAVGIRNTVHVIDLEKTAKHLEKALEFIKKTAQEKGVILFISTKTPLKALVKQAAKDCGMPYVVERWLGGTFTNFKIIQERARQYQELKAKKESGELAKYTKKERIKIEKQLQDMQNKFEGIVALEKLPEVIFICDIVKDHLPLKEASMKAVKSVAIVDTNGDPFLVDYPIPGNDDAISSVKYILEKVKEVILKTKGKA